MVDPWEASSKVRIFQNRFVVLTGLTRPSQAPQYQASTFRIITRIMKLLRRDPSNEPSGHGSDETFGENLFIGPLSGSWNIPDHQGLRHFGWVLHYIRDGWSMKARVAKDILSCAKYPYRLSYDIEQPTRAFLNPNLCPKWTETLLATNTVLPKVENLVIVIIVYNA